MIVEADDVHAPPAMENCGEPPPEMETGTFPVIPVMVTVFDVVSVLGKILSGPAVVKLNASGVVSCGGFVIV